MWLRRISVTCGTIALIWSIGAVSIFARQQVSSYQWTTLAGRPVTTAVDGSASTAIFSSPAGMVTLPDDSVLVADSTASVIRRVTTDGTVSTYVGQLHTPGWADGALTEARFTRPVGVARSVNGDVFVVEHTDTRTDLVRTRIRRITAAGVVSTLTEIDGAVSPMMAVDPDGIVYVASSATVIRIAADGTQSRPFTQIGSGVSGLAWHPTLNLIAFKRAGTILNSVILSISTEGSTVLAGNAQGSGALVDGVGTAAGLGVVEAWTVASTGRVYFGDGNTVRAFDPGGQVTTLAGTTTSGATDGVGAAARFNGPTGLTARSDGSVLVADTGNRVVRLLSVGGTVSTLAGADVYVVARDGVGTQARFARAAGIDRLPNGDLLVADLEAHAIRRVTPAGVVTTFAGELNVGGFADGVGAAAKFNFPIDVAVAPDGRVYVADYGNHAIRVIGTNGAVTTVAGPQPGPTFTPGAGSGNVDGAAADARFNNPMAVAIGPSGVVYVADHRNRAVRVIRTDGSVATFWTTGFATGVAVASDGTLRVSVSRDFGGAVHRVTTDGTGTLLAGGSQGYWMPYTSNVDGTGAAAAFVRPAGLEVDAAGDAFIADDIKVRRVTDTGVTTSLGGEESAPSSLGWPSAPTRREADGVGGLARFAEAWGVTRHTDGRLGGAERGRIRLGTPVSGEAPVILTQPTNVSTTAGTPTTMNLSVSGSGVEYALERRVLRTGGHPITNVLVWEEVLQPVGHAWTPGRPLSTWRPEAADNGAPLRIVASNGFGRTVSDLFRLEVQGPPALRAISGDRTLRLGQSAQFDSVSSGGAPTPTFQWQTSVDGVSGWTPLVVAAPFSTATVTQPLSTGADEVRARLSISAAPLSLHGLFLRVVATNPSGTATSDPVQVSVAAAVFSQQPLDVAPARGPTATIGAIVDALGGVATYQWQSLVGSTWTNLADDGNISGAQTTTLVIANATTPMTLRLVVSANGGTAISRTVTMVPTTVTFAATPTSLTFIARRTAGGGYEVPAAKPVSVSVTATASVYSSWAVTSAPAWVTTSRTTTGGSWPTGVVEVGVVSGYDFGTATTASGTVTIAGSATTASGTVPVTATVAVSLSLLPESTNGLPFGNLDTPASGATGLAGAVAVTGWALDDIGVTRVEIWRDCVEAIDRSRGACRPTPNNDRDAVYVGDALFVSGARPDVASQFSQLPQADRAGWGLMVLTNMLPHIPNAAAVGGQGTFQISAYAVDTAGAGALLGRSLVTVDNDNSQLPFGAIDSPASGGVLVANQVFSGWGIGAGNRCLASYRLYVDGVVITSSNGLNTAQQSPRSDVDALFPASCPSQQKGLQFFLSGLAIPNGRHTVSFEATDTLGNVGQFGSRFFDVLAPVVATDPAAAVEEAPQPRAVARGASTRDRVVAHIGGTDAAPVAIERGSDGVYRVILPVGERLRLDLGGPVESGAQEIDGRPATLPGGSHLDVGTGIFSWEPPLGYFGMFELQFDTQMGTIRVAIVIQSR